MKQTLELEKNDILYSSWGYGQTNIDFYKVKKLVGKTMIEIVAIESKMTDEQNSPYEDMVVPYPAAEGKTLRRKIKGGLGTDFKPYVNINTYSTANFWEGNPVAQTNANYGH